MLDTYCPGRILIPRWSLTLGWGMKPSPLYIRHREINGGVHPRAWSPVKKATTQCAQLTRKTMTRSNFLVSKQRYRFSRISSQWTKSLAGGSCHRCWKQRCTQCLEKFPGFADFKSAFPLTFLDIFRTIIGSVDELISGSYYLNDQTQL